jgi:membrane protein required for beta-lactamase induction
VQYLLQGWFYGLASLLFQLIILLYCFGPQNLWADAFACITSLTQDGPGVAAEKLKATFGLSDGGNVQKLHTDFLGGIFVQAHNRVFAVVFWYAILGPAGAMLYRAIAAASVSNAAQEVVPELAQPAHTVEEILNWLPARLFTLLFALAGHFSHVFSSWRKAAPAGLAGNETLIASCGIAALGRDDQEKIAADGSVERNAVNLLDRVFVIVLVLVLILALVE